jgi:hypothetical protein
MSSAFGKMTIQARDRIAGPGVSIQHTYDYFDSLISEKGYINFIYEDKKELVLKHFREKAAQGNDRKKTHAQLVILLPPNEQRIELHKFVQYQEKLFADAQARAQREAEAEAEAKRQREARAEAQRQEAERQREAQRQEAERQANAALRAKLNANNAQKTPRTRKRNQNKANRNTRNLLASNINNAPINQQILRGRQVRLANPNSRVQAIQDNRDGAEYLEYQLISAIPRSTDTEGLKQLYKEHFKPFLKIKHLLESVNKKIGVINRKKKMTQVEKNTEIGKLIALMNKLTNMFEKKSSFLKLIENRIRELIPSIKTHANFINEVAVPADAALEEAAPASVPAAAAPAAAAAAAALEEAAPAAAAAAAVPPEYGPQGLRAPGGQLQNEDEDAPPGNAAQIQQDVNARVRESNNEIKALEKELKTGAEKVDRLTEALMMPGSGAPKGGRKRTRKHKKSRRN